MQMRDIWELTPESENDRAAQKILVILAALGFFLGFLRSQYQWSTDIALVVAGQVALPETHPWYIHSMKAWSALNQLSAFLAHLGFSPKHISYVISGLAGAFSFPALGLFFFALSRRFLFSLLFPFFCFMIRWSDHVGLNYPIHLLGVDQTYAMFSTTVFVFAFSLFALRHYRLGGFLLGFAPALHPSQGLWLWLVFGLAFAWTSLARRRWAFPVWPGFLLGLAFAALSAFYHFRFQYFAPPISAELMGRVQSAMAIRCEHFQKFSLVSGITLKILAGTIFLIYLLRRRLLGDDENFLLRTLLVSVGAGMALSFVYWVPPESAPSFYGLLAAMPSRMTNYLILVAVPIFVAVSLRLSRHPLHLANLALQSFFFLFWGRAYSSTDTFWGIVQPTDLVAAQVLFAYLGFFWIESGAIGPNAREKIAGFVTRNRGRVRDFVVYLFLFAALFESVDAHKFWRLNQSSYFLDWTNDPMMQKIHETRNAGLLLAFPRAASALAMRTLRGSLEINGPNTLIYAWEGAPVYAEVLRDLYAEDLYLPSEESKNQHYHTPLTATRLLWGKFTLSDWQALKRRFGISHVLIPPDTVRMSLPAIFQNTGLILYEIP